MILVFRYFKIKEDDCRLDKMYYNHQNIYGRSNIPFKIKFVIPVRKASREDAEKSMRELMSNYNQPLDLFFPSKSLDQGRSESTKITV